MSVLQRSFFSFLFCMFSFQSVADAQEMTSPKFEDYPPSLTTNSQVMTVPLDVASHPKAYEYRSHLSRAAQTGPNFAGHYTLASWDCGFNCLTVAIIDKTTGAVYFPNELAFLGVGLTQYEVDSAAALRDQPTLNYRQDSKLLVVTGTPTPDGATRKSNGIFYYVWESNRLKLIGQAIANTEITPELLP